MSTPAGLSPADFLASWLPGNRGLCRICNAGAPIASPLSCPTGCDLIKPYTNWHNFEVVRRPRVEVYRPFDVAERPLNVPVPVVRSLAELYTDETIMAPAEMIVPGLVEAGTGTLLAAPPKTGKSQLITQIAADFSAGRPALDGTPMGPGMVLWLATDEPLRRLIPRFQSLGADPHNVRIVARDGVSITIEMFAALLDIEDPALVVVDTLSQLASDNRVKPNDAESVVPFMKGLLDAVQRRPRCGAVFIFHAPHHAARASGSVQWSAIVDATLVLRRPAARMLRPGESMDDDTDAGTQEDGRRILEGVTRWGGEQKVHLSFREGRYSLGGAEAPLIDRVRWLLRQTEAGPERTSQATIAERLRTRPASVADVVHQLISRGEAKSIGTGRKRYIAPIASLSVYAGSASDTEGSAGENMREEKEMKTEPFASRTETQVRQHGKRKESQSDRPADESDEEYFAGLVNSGALMEDEREVHYDDAA